MAEFFAVAPRGLTPVLEQELKSFGLNVYDTNASGVFFKGSWEDCYLANLKSRIASRILKPLIDFPAYQGEELYNNVIKHDFTKYIDPNQTLKVDASVSESMIHDQRFVALKIKDAIVDQFRDKFGVRPNVDTAKPDMQIVVRGIKNTYRVFLDTSGEALHRRGYRDAGGEAPLKENLAAGLIALSGWKPGEVLVDPLCGSGTFLIEAAMIARNIAPGTFRKRFAFMNFKNFEKEKWSQLVEKVLDEEVKTELPVQFFGSDIDRKTVFIAKQNAKNAGVEDLIQFKTETVATIKGATESLGPKGFLITNPPYGSRIGEWDNLRDVYRDLAHTLKTEFKNWTAWILSGNKDLIGDLKLKSSQRVFVYNGPIECRFLKYEMF
jgi:putative N6-adenine-specific DNA methylase